MPEDLAFLGPEPDPEGPPAVTGNISSSPRRTTIAGAGWILATAACSAAALSDLYTYRFIDILAPRGGYDAFGNALDRNLAGDRGPRWAIPLWLLAVAFAVLAVVTLRTAAARDRPLPGWAAPVGMISAAALAGITTGVWLFVDSAQATYEALAASLDENVDVQIGGCPWFATVAVACAVAGGVLTGWRATAADVRGVLGWITSYRTPAHSADPDPSVEAGEELVVGRPSSGRHRPEGAPKTFDI
jgi:hypothetical protein